MGEDYLSEALQYFLIDSFEDLETVNNDMVELEQSPQSDELLARVFRAIHTIKGTGGCLGFDVINRLAHAGEDVLHGMREGSVDITPASVSLVLDMADGLKSLLNQIESTGADTGVDVAHLLDRLVDCRNQAIARKRAAEIASATSLARTPQAPAATPAKADASAPRFGDLLVERGYISEADVEAAIAQQAGGDPRHLGEILVERGLIESATVRDVLNMQEQRKLQQAHLDSSIRVNVSHLDHLMNLIGELVLTRNQMQQYTAIATDVQINPIAHRLNLITTDLQATVMQTRLQTLQTVFAGFPRIVRDLAIACDKQVHLEVDGGDTELDRSLIEAIRDPLTHLVRNAVDHGIEPPEVRLQKGKPAQGVLHVRASHIGGQVSIEVSDDGSGMNADKIRQRAVERGIIRPEAAQELSEQASLELIFEPGFSTAETISEISGRGVGMDVVLTNVKRAGGLIEISTMEGAGTVFASKSR